MLVLSRYALSTRHRDQDQLAGPAGRRADDGRAVLRDGGRPLARAGDALRRAWRCALDWRRLCTFAVGLRELAAAQTLKLRLTLWERAVILAAPATLDTVRTGGHLLHGHVSRPWLADGSGAQGPDQGADREEMEISYKRRILHGKIDILRAELVNRLRKKEESGELVISGADIQQLTDILAGRVPAVGSPSSAELADAGGPALPRVRLRQRRRRQLLPALRRVPGAVRAAARRDDRDLQGRRDGRARGDGCRRGRRRARSGARDPRRRRARRRELPARAATA